MKIEALNPAVGMSFEEAREAVTGTKFEQCSKFKWTLDEDVSFEDLESFADVGILKAYRSFDPSRGACWNTHAHNYIYWSLLDNLNIFSKKFKECEGNVKLLNQSKFHNDESEDFDIIDTVAVDDTMGRDRELYKTYIPTLPQKAQVVAKMIFEGNEVSDIAKKLRVTKSQLMKMFGADHDSQYGRLTENNTVKLVRTRKRRPMTH